MWITIFGYNITIPYITRMYIKEINKRNKPGGKTFKYFQLTEAVRVGKKTMQRVVLYLGYDSVLEDKDKRRTVGKLLEAKITGKEELSKEFLKVPARITKLVDALYLKYLQKNKSEEDKEKERQAEEARFEPVDLSSLQLSDSKEIGAEAISLGMLDRIGIGGFLERKGWIRRDIDRARISIVSRAVFASSENRTDYWLRKVSGLMELFPASTVLPNRNHLYKASSMLYELKDELETFIYERLGSMFDVDDKIVIYDLTNTYFEGRKENSKIAKFGRSKEKRSDCRLVVLAAVINRQGFLKHSKIYEGNMSDPETVVDMVTNLDGSKGSSSPLVVMDAGIATEDNLTMLRNKGYKYVCVARSKPGKEDLPKDTPPFVTEDKRHGKIKLRFMKMISKPDRWVQVESSGKKKKEESMHDKAAEKFETELKGVDKATRTKGGTKRIEKVWERLGRIKERNKRVAKYYNIEVISQGNIVTRIKWNKKKIKESRGSGTYYLRTNSALNSEKEIWDTYNTVRDVESTFRCLKTDLNLRPVFHQKDENVEAHLHLGLLAYNIVAPIRYMLKQKGINNAWRNIVLTMNTQKVGSAELETRDRGKVVIRTCTRPSREVLEIYQALGMSSMPVARKNL